ncbi:hypothetical protein R3P38DRAFT_2758880 [Favolaschia claudopus]|uniref:Uncharacterized protein n=1 Tax=Favolaschia claudopus TaxID=2862362 RepID=A0AAW0E2A3_9AGAR
MYPALDMPFASNTQKIAHPQAAGSAAAAALRLNDNGGKSLLYMGGEGGRGGIKGWHRPKSNRIDLGYRTREVVNGGRRRPPVLRCSKWPLTSSGCERFYISVQCPKKVIVGRRRCGDRHQSLADGAPADLGFSGHIKISGPAAAGLLYRVISR